MEKKVTIYSCSGCSNLAQLANSVAVKLHREKITNMSCIAGVGGDVTSLVKTAKTAETILALDGCPLACVEKCLKRHEINPNEHIVLTDLKLTKNCTSEASEEEFKSVYHHVLEKINLLKV